MLNNTLPLVNGGITVDVRRFEENLNRTVYIFPDHTQRAPHTLTLYRTMAKRQGIDLGRDKRAVKITVPQVVKNGDEIDVLRSIIAELTLSLPVGAESKTIQSVREELVAFIVSDAFESLVSIGEI